MAARVVVSQGRGGKFKVTLEKAGKPLLVSGTFDDKRAAAGLIRSLKGVLTTEVSVVDESAPAKKVAAAK